jgi:methylated-DNA-[protein]-cysteine S-methyltransferase
MKKTKKSFSGRCYEILKKVPKGKVTTYKEIGRALHSRAYQAVGSAMKRNPYATIVPCHRVVRSDGDVGGFASGVNNKIKILKKEGIEIKNKKINIKNFFYKLK